MFWAALKKYEKIVVVIAILGMLYLIQYSIHDRGFQEGFRHGVAYQKCMDELGGGCTKEISETKYYHNEKNVLAYMYPIKFNLTIKGSDSIARQ